MQMFQFHFNSMKNKVEVGIVYWIQQCVLNMFIDIQKK